MPDTPLQSDSTTEMLLNASHEKSVLLKTVAFQLCLEEPKDLFREPQVGTWEGKETAAGFMGSVSAYQPPAGKLT